MGFEGNVCNCCERFKVSCGQYIRIGLILPICVSFQSWGEPSLDMPVLKIIAICRYTLKVYMEARIGQNLIYHR